MFKRIREGFDKTVDHILMQRLNSIIDLYSEARIPKSKKTPYLKELESSKSKRTDTFETTDNLIHNMEFDQRCELYFNMYKNSQWLQRGIEAISSECINAPLELYYDEEMFTSNNNYRKLIHTHINLLEQPVKSESNENEFYTLTYHDLLITGNAFWQKMWNVTRTDILYYVRIRPETIRIVPKIDPKTNLVYYFYLQKVGTNDLQQNVYQVYSEDEIIHFKIPNPINPLYGRSKLDGLLHIVYMDIKAQEFQSKFFEHGITPGCIISVSSMSEDQQDRFNEMLQERYANDKEPYSAMILSGDNVKIVNDKDNMSDLDLRDLRNSSADEILDILGIPPLILSKGRSQVDRQDTPYDLFVRMTINPLRKIIYSTYNEQVLNRHYKKDMINKIVKVRPGVHAVRGTIDAAEYVLKALQASPMTLNEVRELLGLTLLEEGGEQFVFYTPNGIRFVGQEYNTPDAEQGGYEVDENGKVIDPEKMFSNMNLTLAQPHKLQREYLEHINKVFADIEFKRKRNRFITSSEELKIEKYEFPVVKRDEQEVEKNDLLGFKVDNLQKLINDIKNNRRF